MEIRRAVGTRPRRPALRDVLRAALLVVAGALFFIASLAGYVLVAVMSVAALRLAWGALARRRSPRPAPPTRVGGLPGARLRLVSAADDAA